MFYGSIYTLFRCLHLYHNQIVYISIPTRNKWNTLCDRRYMKNFTMKSWCEKEDLLFQWKGFLPYSSPLATTMLLFLSFPSLPTAMEKNKLSHFLLPMRKHSLTDTHPAPSPLPGRMPISRNAPQAKRETIKAIKRKKWSYGEERELFFPEILVHESIFHDPQPMNSQISNSQRDKRGIFLVYIAIFQTYRQKRFLLLLVNRKFPEGIYCKINRVSSRKFSASVRFPVASTPFERASAKRICRIIWSTFMAE